MDGDNEFQQQQPQEPIEQTEESYNPVDIAEAFKMARSLDKETASPSVEAPEVQSKQLELPKDTSLQDIQNLSSLTTADIPVVEELQLALVPMITIANTSK